MMNDRRFDVTINDLSRVVPAIMLSCAVLSGCGSSDKKPSEPNDPVSVSIHETGGEDGRDIDWKVYPENDSYILSYSDNRGSCGEPFHREIELTEQEYETVMSFDYKKIADEYDESFWKNVADAIYFQTTLAYENGEERSTDAIMTDVTIKLRDLLSQHPYTEGTTSQYK